MLHVGSRLIELVSHQHELIMKLGMVNVMPPIKPGKHSHKRANQIIHRVVRGDSYCGNINDLNFNCQGRRR